MQRRWCPAVQDYGSARSGKRLGDGKPDPARCAGNQRRPTRQTELIHHHGFTFVQPMLS